MFLYLTNKIITTVSGGQTNHSMRQPSDKLTRLLFTALFLSLSLLTFAQNAEEEGGKMRPASTEPAAGVQIPSNWGISSVSFVFPGGGDMGIEEFTPQNKIATITRNDEEILSIDLNNLNNLSISPKNPNCLILSFPKQTIAGEYTVSIPGGLVKMAENTGMLMPDQEDEPAEDDEIARINSPYSVTFSIVESPDFKILPSTGSLKPDQLHTVTIIYPEGSVIVRNPDVEILPALNLFHGSHSDEETDSAYITDYSVSIENNKVILTANNPDSIVPVEGNASANWDFLSFPEGCWTVTLDGKDYPNPAFKVERYNVTVTLASDFFISPAADSKDYFKPMDLKNVTLRYPEDWKLNGKFKKGSAIGYLRQAGVGEEYINAISGYLAGEYIITDIDKEDRLVSFRLKENAGNTYEGNPDLLESGYYAISINAGVFNQGTAKNNTFAYPGYLLSGLETMIPLEVSVDNLREGNVVLPADGFSKAIIEWPFDLTVNNPDADITLSRNGKVISSIKASSLKLRTSGNKYMELKLSNNPITVVGDYTLNIPFDTFRQASYGNFPNEEYNFNFSIESSPVFTAAPGASDDITVPAVVEDFSEIELVYPQNTFINLPSKFSVDKISLNIITKSDKAIDKTFHPAEVNVDGNVIRMTFDPAINLATGNNEWCYALEIPAGIWNMMRFDLNYSNQKWTGYYTIANPARGTISPAEDMEHPADTNLGEFFFTSPVQPVADILPDAPKAYLLNVKEGTEPQKIAEYNAVLIDEHTVRFFTDAPIIFFYRDFRFVIPSNGQIDFLYAGNDYPEYDFSFKLKDHSGDSAVEEIGGEISITVVTIDGKVLMREAPASAISTLPAGMYIVNNRKVIIR